MANRTANLSLSATTTANVVDVVTLGRGYRAVEISNRSTTADLWVTIDRGVGAFATSTTPDVAADDCYYIAPGDRRLLNDDRFGVGAAPAPASVVRLISAAATPYTVSGVVD